VRAAGISVSPLKAPRRTRSAIHNKYYLDFGIRRTGSANHMIILIFAAPAQQTRIIFSVEPNFLP
jgi:hypothetical protein